MRRFALALMQVSALLAGCTASNHEHPFPQQTSPATTHTGIPTVAKHLGPPPQGCPGPPPRRRAVGPRYFRPLVGGSPLWGGFYAKLDRRANAYSTGANVRRVRYGWRIKVLWLIEPTTTTSVTLSGSNTTTGQPLYFETGGVQPRGPSARLALDPSYPAIPVQHGRWKEFPSYLFAPSAGCYRLTASWAGGSWALGFGFGR